VCSPYKHVDSLVTMELVVIKISGDFNFETEKKGATLRGCSS
jgi:hypothetical protein